MSGAQHKLSGCTNRALSQLEKASAFIQAVSPVLPQAEEDPLRQYLYQSSVLMVQSYFEEYLTCVVSVGSFWKAPEVRLFLGECLSRRDELVSMPAAAVGRLAEGRVSFQDGASKLKELFVVLTGESPFPDEDAEIKCLDFYAVRNIIAHRGGWPAESHRSTVKSANVIIETGTVGEATFYKLIIRPAFFGECLAAIGRSIISIERRVAADAAFSL